MKGKAYAADRSELNREIRRLEEAVEYFEACKLVEGKTVERSTAETRASLWGDSGPSHGTRRFRLLKQPIGYAGIRGDTRGVNPCDAATVVRRP